jgi:GntR family transcriptional repressor for pyruvate dehydrogenase complex
MTKLPPFSTAVKKQTLAEQVALTIKEAILAGQWQPGEALPTEPDLAEAFGVSRAVVRDATRMLAAQGLVEAQHGRGVFVTGSQIEAFGEALLLALRREGASVWDVEQFEQMVLPEVCALAASEATEEELANLQVLAESYIKLFASVATEQWEGADPAAVATRAQVREAFAAFIAAIFEATHNAMWRLLVRPILDLRSLRSWKSEGEEPPPEFFVAMEQQFLETLISAIASGDPATARAAVAELVRLPREAEAAMRNTPVGEIPHIQIGKYPSL